MAVQDSVKMYTGGGYRRNMHCSIQEEMGRTAPSRAVVKTGDCRTVLLYQRYEAHCCERQGWRI